MLSLMLPTAIALSVQAEGLSPIKRLIIIAVGTVVGVTGIWLTLYNRGKK